MKLVVAPGATAQITARKRWWRVNRSQVPARFDDELAAALAKIAESPNRFPSSRPVVESRSDAAFS